MPSYPVTSFKSVSIRSAEAAKAGENISIHTWLYTSDVNTYKTAKKNGTVEESVVTAFALSAADSGDDVIICRIEGSTFDFGGTTPDAGTVIYLGDSGLMVDDEADVDAGEFYTILGYIGDNDNFVYEVTVTRQEGS
jgi:hypothetical protein